MPKAFTHCTILPEQGLLLEGPVWLRPSSSLPVSIG